MDNTVFFLSVLLDKEDRRGENEQVLELVRELCQHRNIPEERLEIKLLKGFRTNFTPRLEHIDGSRAEGLAEVKEYVRKRLLMKNPLPSL